MFEWSPLFEKLHLNDELNNLETCLKENKTFCNKDSTINFIYNEAGFDVPQPILNGAKDDQNIFILKYNGITFFSLSKFDALIALNNFRLSELKQPDVTTYFRRIFMGEMEMASDEIGFHQGLFRKFMQIKDAINKGGARLEIKKGKFEQFNDNLKFEAYFREQFGHEVLQHCLKMQEEESAYNKSKKSESFPFKNAKPDSK